MNIKKSYRPKSGHEGASITFPNALTGETVDIASWPYETNSSVEMAHLDGHPWLTDRPEPKSSASGEKPLSKMTKAELLDHAAKVNVGVFEEMTKAQIVHSIEGKLTEQAETPPSPEENTDSGGSE